MNRMMKALGGLLLAATLVACGGGGGSPGTNPNQPPSTGTGGDGGTGTTGGTPVSAVADFAIFTDKTTITNSGTDSAKVTVVAVDANRNVVSGAAVSTTVDQNAIFVPSGTATDATGTYTGQVQTGGDKTDRDITVTVTVNGITKRATVRVSGSKLALSASPNPAQPSQQVALSATLRDAANTPIQGVEVTFGGTLPAAIGQKANTNASGVATVNVAAPTNAGVYTVTASGGGTVATDYQLQVFAAGSSVPPAAIPAGVTPSLSANPNVLSVNTTTATNKSTLRFVMLDSGNNPIKNVRVRFDDQTTGLPRQGATLSSTATLFTDVSGSVTVDYFPGPNSSSTNGVKIRACYSATDFASATDCPLNVETTLTVAGQALSVSIGDDNLLQAASGTYIKRFAITVADSAGRAVANAPVDISVDLTHYGKGEASTGYVGSTTDKGLSVLPLSSTGAYPSITTDPAGTQRVWCPNEDYNRNTRVDAVPDGLFGPGITSENYNGSVDSNGQPTLQPLKADLLINYDNPSVTTTNADGLLIIKVQYSQRFATWLAYKIRVTADVSGSQGMAERTFITDFLDADKSNGSFLTPPYGVNRCTLPN